VASLLYVINPNGGLMKQGRIKRQLQEDGQACRGRAAGRATGKTLCRLFKVEIVIIPCENGKIWIVAYKINYMNKGG